MEPNESRHANLKCASPLADGPCGEPILVDEWSYTGYSHSHRKDAFGQTISWLHWAMVEPHTATSQDFLPCRICHKEPDDNKEHFLITGHRFMADTTHGMDEKKLELKLGYDAKNDVLYCSFGDPQEAYSEEVEDGIFARVNPDDRFVGMTVVDFRKRFATHPDKMLSFPIQADGCGHFARK